MKTEQQGKKIKFHTRVLHGWLPQVWFICYLFSM